MPSRRSVYILWPKSRACKGFGCGASVVNILAWNAGPSTADTAAWPRSSWYAIQKLLVEIAGGYSSRWGRAL
jgi:hypothetical protein